MARPGGSDSAEAALWGSWDAPGREGGSKSELFAPPGERRFALPPRLTPQKRYVPPQTTLQDQYSVDSNYAVQQFIWDVMNSK